MRKFIKSEWTSAAYGMTRVTLLLHEWRKAQGERSIEFDRLALIDFAAQFPRYAERVHPGISLVIRAHGLAEGDLGDLFARRNFYTARQQLQVVLSELIARDVAAEDIQRDISGGAFLVTDVGEGAANRIASPLSFALRALYAEFIAAWGSASVQRLESALRDSLPALPGEIAALRVPFNLAMEDAWPNV